VAAAPDETTILRFRHLLEAHDLCGEMLMTVNRYLETKGIRITTGTIVDATIIHAPSSTKNSSGERDPEMHQTKKGNQWYFGAKAHIGVDSKETVVHSVATSAASVADKHMLPDLLHGGEKKVWGDAEMNIGQISISSILSTHSPGLKTRTRHSAGNRVVYWMLVLRQ
jgi:IS5 family transposase